MGKRLVQRATNMVFTLLPDGTVEVEKPDTGERGVFRRDGSRVSGDLTYADRGGPVVMPASFLDAQRTRRPGVLIAEPAAVSRGRRARGRLSRRPQRHRPRGRCGGPWRRPARDRRRVRDRGAGTGCRRRH